MSPRIKAYLNSPKTKAYVGAAILYAVAYAPKVVAAIDWKKKK